MDSTLLIERTVVPLGWKSKRIKTNLKLNLIDYKATLALVKPYHLPKETKCWLNALGKMALLEFSQWEAMFLNQICSREGQIRLEI